jgi:hypothetical protein
MLELPALYDDSEEGLEGEKMSKRRMTPPSVGFFLLIVLLSVSLAVPVCASAQSSLSAAKNFDGPAELPREYVQSALKDTPAGGKTWSVHSGESLEEVLGKASCGDTVQLQAGATFSGNFAIPEKHCDDMHWIIIRTSAPDSSLPAEGTRLTPCYAGVSSLPGRPGLNCASTANVLAKIEFNGKGGSGPIAFSPGANHYRLMGLEVTRSQAPVDINNLIQFLGTADHVVFDRLWIHGTAQDATVRGIMLGVSRNVAIVDSYFTDFHCVVKTSSCTDAQTIGGGIGDGPMGPYKIVDNFLESAGENVMFGGGRSTMTPKDIEVRRNHMFKPLTWMQGHSGFVGGTNGNSFIIKNLFELKNAQRVLLEGNILENCWGGFTQAGFAILLTPKNPGGCTSCQVTDVTIRYNSVGHVGSGLQIVNALSDGGAAAIDGQRYSIHDVVIDDIDGAKYNGPGEFAEIAVVAGAALLQNVAINHVTAFPSRMLFMIGDMVATSGPMKNFVFSNSIVNAGVSPVWSTGGGPANCAFHNIPVTTFNACFSGSTFTANAIIGAPPAYSGSAWPAKQLFPSSAAAVRFSNYNGGNGGDYHLQPSSPYKGKSTDGKDLGADIDAIHSATAGVE